MPFPKSDARGMTGSSGGWLGFLTNVAIIMIIRTTFSLLGLAALGLANLNDYEYNYEEYDDAGDEESNPEEVDREVNYEQVNIFVKSMVIDQLTILPVWKPVPLG